MKSAEEQAAEQARLLGMSAEREAGHLAEIEGLKKTMQTLVDALKYAADLPVDDYPNDHDDDVLRVHAEHAYAEANDALSMASEKHGIKPSTQ